MDATTRRFTGPLRQFVLARDQHCRLTGAKIADADHRIRHHHGGPTTAHNGQGLGKLAHLVKDHPALTVVALPPIQLDDGLDPLRAHAPDIDWRLPTGHHHHRRPPPTLGHGTRPADPHPDSTGEQHFAARLVGPEAHRS